MIGAKEGTDWKPPVVEWKDLVDFGRQMRATYHWATAEDLSRMEVHLHAMATVALNTPKELRIR